MKGIFDPLERDFLSLCAIRVNLALALEQFLIAGKKGRVFPKRAIDFIVDLRRRLPGGISSAQSTGSDKCLERVIIQTIHNAGQDKRAGAGRYGDIDRGFGESFGPQSRSSRSLTRY